MGHVKKYFDWKFVASDWEIRAPLADSRPEQQSFSSQKHFSHPPPSLIPRNKNGTGGQRFNEVQAESQAVLDAVWKEKFKEVTVALVLYSLPRRVLQLGLGKSVHFSCSSLGSFW